MSLFAGSRPDLNVRDAITRTEHRQTVAPIRRRTDGRTTRRSRRLRPKALSRCTRSAGACVDAPAMLPVAPASSSRRRSSLDVLCDDGRYDDPELETEPEQKKQAPVVAWLLGALEETHHG